MEKTSDMIPDRIWYSMPCLREASVHGIMDGEAMKLYDRGNFRDLYNKQVPNL